MQIPARDLIRLIEQAAKPAEAEAETEAEAPGWPRGLANNSLKLAPDRHGTDTWIGDFTFRYINTSAPNARAFSF